MLLGLVRAGEEEELEDVMCAGVWLWAAMKDFREEEGGGMLESILEAKEEALRCSGAGEGGGRMVARELVRDPRDNGGGEEGEDGEEEGVGGRGFLKNDPPHEGGGSTVVLALPLLESIPLDIYFLSTF